MERLNGLFKRAGIKHIVSVDDCFMQEVDEGLLRIQDHMATHLKTAICFLREMAKTYLQIPSKNCLKRTRMTILKKSAKTLQMKPFGNIRISI